MGKLFHKLFADNKIDKSNNNTQKIHINNETNDLLFKIGVDIGEMKNGLKMNLKYLKSKQFEHEKRIKKLEEKVG